MKKKLLGIFICMLLIATALPAVGTMNEKEKSANSGMCSNSLNDISIHNNIINREKGSLFIQLPWDDLIVGWRSYSSDLGFN